MKKLSVIVLLFIISINLLAIIPPDRDYSTIPGYKSPPKKEVIMNNYYLVVELKNYKMYLYEDQNIVKEYSIAIGKNPGDKEKVGDSRTPWGNFRIEKIEPAEHWVYNYGDGKGYVHAYGKWFIRLETNEEQTFSGNKWTGIGIHGTHEEESIGTRASRGCLRMHNNELEELVEFLNSLPDFHLSIFVRQSIPLEEDFLGEVQKKK